MTRFMNRPTPLHRRPHRFLIPALATLALAGCFGGGAAKKVTYDPEEFDSTTTHTRSYWASSGQTCEAARRALLSQGYLLTAANGELVTGKKNFQPSNEVHVEVEFRVVCAHSEQNATGTTVFVTAIQDRYALKKASNSASVGVGAIGSVSLPFQQSDDAMVKVASETLTEERFYDRFYVLLDRFLPAVPKDVKPPVTPSAPAPGVTPNQTPAQIPAAASTPVPAVAPSPSVSPPASPSNPALSPAPAAPAGG
jgi:hypothetical protein